MKDALARLFSSHKALVVMFVTAAVLGLVYSRRVEWGPASDLLKWVLGPWLLGQGLEDAGKQLGKFWGTSVATPNAATATTLPPAAKPDP